VYLVLSKYGKSKNERRLVVSHIHVRVPQGFAYSIQFALQCRALNVSTASATTTPSAERSTTWTISDVAKTQRKEGEDRGEQDGSIYSCQVDHALAGVRAISPSDEMHRILAKGHVDVHSCQRVGLPEPHLSKFKVAFKAHFFNGHAGSASHLVYLRQQMAKPAPDTTPVMEDMCERMFGGHEADMNERRDWRKKYDLAGRPDPSLLAMATAWLRRGATKGMLGAAQFDAADAGARQTFSEGRGATQQKRKWQYGAGTGWQGRNAHAAHPPWAGGAPSTLPTHFSSWSFTRGQHTGVTEVGQECSQPQPWTRGPLEETFTAPSSSSSHNPWVIRPPGLNADTGASWTEGWAQQEVSWGHPLEAQAGVLGQDVMTQLPADASWQTGFTAAGETQQEVGWANGADAANSASGLNTWDMQPSATSDASWPAGLDTGGDTQEELGWGTVTDALTAANSTSGLDMWDTRPSASSEASRLTGLAAGVTQQDGGWGTFSDAWTAANRASGLNTGDTQPSVTWDGPGWEDPAESHDPQQASEPWYQ
jgi:hypothetical protein